MKMSEIREAQEDHLGWCVKCKDWTHDCAEPDAHKYECPVCECKSVYGAEEAVLLGLITIDEYDDDDDDYDYDLDIPHPYLDDDDDE